MAERAARSGGPKTAGRGGGPKRRPEHRMVVDEATRGQVLETIQFYQKEWRNLCRAAVKRKFRDDKGRWYPNPAVAMRDRAAQELHRWLTSYVQWGVGEGQETGPVVDAQAELVKLRAARKRQKQQGR